MNCSDERIKKTLDVNDDKVIGKVKSDNKKFGGKPLVPPIASRIYRRSS
jgi:hypothetical protein